MSQSELVVIIIVAVSAILLLYVFGLLRENFDQTTDAVCAAQVQEANFRNKFVGRDFAIEIDACQPRTVNIEKKNLPDDINKMDEKVKRIMAEEMRKCWLQWGRGEMDLFDGEGTYCAVCADINIYDEVRQEYQRNGQTSIAMGKYLNTEKTPEKTGTYSQFLLNTDKDNSDEEISPEYDLELAENFTIIYSHAKLLTDGTLLAQLSDAAGYDLSPGDQAKFVGAAFTGVTVGVGGITGGLQGGTWAAGLATTAVTAGIITGPVGWAVIGVGVVVGAVVGGVTAMTVKKAVVGAGMTSTVYIDAKIREDFTVISATYILPRDVNNDYVKACKEMASIYKSP